MASRRLVILIAISILGVAAIVFAAVALARSRELSLPLPASLPALNILIPIVTALAWPLTRSLATQVRKHTLRLALSYLASASTLAPLALLVLSLVYAIPSDIQTCAADRHWLSMFENKDANSIRSIQTRLQCCGLNSMHDRAWPFPSRGVDARACERNQGYTVACGNTWRQEESLAATLTAIASFLNWLMMTLIISTSSESEGQIRLPEWSASRPTHLIEAGEGHGESSHQDRTTTEAESEEERIWNHETQNGR